MQPKKSYVIIKFRAGHGDWASELVGCFSNNQVPGPHKRPTDSESEEGQHEPLIKAARMTHVWLGLRPRIPLQT